MAHRHEVTNAQHVRFYLDGNSDGDNWVECFIEEGAMVVKAADALTIKPVVGNTMVVSNDPS